MGHSRQDGGFAEAPFAPLADYPEIPVSPRAGLEALRPEFTPLPDYAPYKPPKPEKTDGGRPFRSVSEFEPKGDQPRAIAELVAGANAKERDQVLLGVTGSGKTFTMAKIIEATQRAALTPS